MDCATWRRNSHAELEVVDGDPLVGGVDQPRRDLGRHRPQREEPVRDRPERLPQPVRVGEPGDADRRQPARPARAPPRTPRSPTRAASRARSASRPGRRATPARSRPRRATAAARPPRRPRSGRAGAGSRRSPRTGPGSRSASPMPRSSSARPSSRAAARSSPPRPGRSPWPRRAPPPAGGTRSAQRPKEPLRLGRQLRLGRERPEPLDVARRLDERVVGDPRHRPVPAPPVHAQRERRAALLGRRSTGRARGRRSRPGRRRPR